MEARGELKMARYTWIAMLALLASTTGLPTYAADSTSADAQAISKLEQEWTVAVKTNNKAFYEKYLTDDFTYISENGTFSSGRTAYIDSMMKMPKAVEAAASDQKVTVHGTTGVATGRFMVKDGAGVSTTTLYTDVYAKGTDGWKVVASQETTAK
jgi:ketosteroid isomerase-like protein